MTCFIMIGMIIIGFLCTPGRLISQDLTRGHPVYRLIRTMEILNPATRWVFPAENPAVAVQHDRLSVFTQAGQENTFFPEGIHQAVFSRNARYYSLIESQDTAEANRTDRQLRITIYNAENQKQYALQYRHFYDDPLPQLVISDRDGSLIIAQNSSGEVRFYDRRGRLLKQVPLFSGIGYDLERVLSMDISADGAAIAIAAGKHGASPAGSQALQPSAEPHLLLFSPTGEELWRRALPGFNTRTAVISDDATAIAVNSYRIDMQGTLQKQTLVFDRAGREITRVPSLFKQARFSPDGGFLLLAENNSVMALELPGGEISWHQNISGKEGLIAGVETAASGKTTVLLLAKNQFKDGAFVFSEPILLMLNRSGEIFQRLELSGLEFLTPSLQISADVQEIAVGFKNTCQIYRVQP